MVALLTPAPKRSNPLIKMAINGANNSNGIPGASGSSAGIFNGYLNSQHKNSVDSGFDESNRPSWAYSAAFDTQLRLDRAQRDMNGLTS